MNKYFISMLGTMTDPKFWNEQSGQFGTSIGREVMDFIELPLWKRWPIRYFETYEENNLNWCWKGSYGLLRVATTDTMTNPIFWNQFWKGSYGLRWVATLETMTDDQSDIYKRTKRTTWTDAGREDMDFFEMPQWIRWPIWYFETHELNNLEPVLDQLNNHFCPIC